MWKTTSFLFFPRKFHYVTDSPKTNALNYWLQNFTMRHCRIFDVTFIAWTTLNSWPELTDNNAKGSIENVTSKERKVDEKVTGYRQGMNLRP